MYESVLHGEVQKPGLGPLHTEFDGKGNAYASMFFLQKWWNEYSWPRYGSRTYVLLYRHLMVVGGDSKKPYGKYLVAYNKITKDRYLPTGPELNQTAQLFDISGDKMKLLLDFPTAGEPHYAQAMPAEKIAAKSLKIYDLMKNKNPFVTMGEKESRVERKGNRVMFIWRWSVRTSSWSLRESE